MSRDRGALEEELRREIRRGQTVQDAFDEAAVARLGINRTDNRCLDIIDRAGRASAGRIARESGLSSGAVTAVIDRLERRGYVRRVRDPEDRRRVLVELTEDLRARAEEVWGPLGARGAAQLAAYSDEELALITRFLREGGALLEEEAARVRALPPLTLE